LALIRYTIHLDEQRCFLSVNELSPVAIPVGRMTK